MDDRILSHYSKNPETDRLNQDWFILERIRTEYLLKKLLPPPPCQVLDIGGGTGVYSFFLAEKGYTVHLIDPVPIHIQRAEEFQKDNKTKLASIQIGNAIHLHEHDESMDAVLMFGPLYHLIETEHRFQALKEAHRVLRKGGLFLGVGISKYASYMDGFLSKFLLDEEYRMIVENDLNTGRHINPTDKEYFTTSYFHHPTHLKKEIEQAGFADVRLVAIEGPSWAYPDMEELLVKNQKASNKILEFIELMESDESIIGASAHFMGIGRK